MLRSNQLNYVPTLFSSGLLETRVFTVLPRSPRFPLLPFISTPYHRFRALMDTMDTMHRRTSVHALRVNCNRPNSDQYRSTPDWRRRLEKCAQLSCLIHEG